jgi:hypothetical protein
MNALLIPATTYDRGVARRLWSRLDQIEGFPRTHAADEPGVAVAPGAALPYTETLWSAHLHADGRVALVMGQVPERLLSRRITYSGTTRTVGQWLQRLVADRGWQLVSELPGQPEDTESASPWTPLAVRDGAAGSTTGVPIPEGEE